MGYRGQDIDLRTPQTWAATPADVAGTMGGGNGPRGRGYEYEVMRGGPIWVDDTLLACCNHAFDVALAHRSSEVRLEHLLHALTRIDAAVASLEAHGIRAAGLRRESATIIASEIPVGLSNGKNTPRRSAEMEEALRLAAQQAYRRNVPASVDDLVDALLDLRPDLPGLALLERHIGAGGREAAPLTPLRPRLSFSPEPDFAEPRERVRRPAGRYYVSEAEQARERTPSTTDQIQNSRIEALEQMVRSLGGQVSGHRDESSRFSLGIDERLQSIERLVSSGMSPSAAAPGQLLDRLAALERAIDGRLAEVAHLATGLTDRLDQLERSVGESGATADFAAFESKLGQLEMSLDLAPLSSRLETIEEAVLARATSEGAGERLAALESALRAVEEAERAHRSEIYETHAALTSEIKATVAAVAGEAQRAAARHIEFVNGFQGLVRQLGAIETQVRAGLAKSEEVNAAYGEDLKELHEALMKLNTNQHTLAASLDQWRLDASGDVSVMSNRLAAIESEAGKPMRLLEQLTAGMESMSGSMETMHRLTVRRYYRRNRFWYWLFGTDDWVAASWPSQAARIESEQRALKTAAEAK